MSGQIPKSRMLMKISPQNDTTCPTSSFFSPIRQHQFLNQELAPNTNHGTDTLDSLILAMRLLPRSDIICSRREGKFLAWSREEKDALLTGILFFDMQSLGMVALEELQILGEAKEEPVEILALLTGGEWLNASFVLDCGNQLLQWIFG